MATGLKLTRNQLAEFLKDHESIKQFEKLFVQVAQTTPDEVGELNVSAGYAQSIANEALAQIKRIADAIELLALAPVAVHAKAEDEISPVVQVGTLGQQQSDRVSITGGVVTAQLQNNQTILLETTVGLTNGAAAAAATLLNSPAAGNPTKWVPINDNGTTRYIPTW